MPPSAVRALHAWDLPPAEAIALQRRLAGRVARELPAAVRTRGFRLVAGCDVASTARAVRGRPIPSADGPPEELVAAVVVLSLPDLATVEEAVARAPARFPYVPGLLSFREAPGVLAAFRKLRARPDALLADGQGIAHPRRLGIASHLGLWLGIPTVGCAKSLLVGEAGPLGAARGRSAPILDRGEVVGAALRTREGVRPVYVSIGHRTDLESALALVLACTAGLRLPEPTRRAHALVTNIRDQGSGVGNIRV